MVGMGNSRGRAVYEANLPDNFRRPQTDVALENFIRAKYEHKKYIAKEWAGHPPVGKVDWSEEIEEMIRAKKKTSGAAVGTGSSLFHGKMIGQQQSNNKKANNNSEVVQLAKVVAPPAEELLPPVVPEDDLVGVAQSDLLSSDLASVFTTTTANEVDQIGGGGLSGLKMTKENIMSLYGSQQQSSSTNYIQQQSSSSNIQPQNNPFMFMAGATTTTTTTSTQQQQSSQVSDTNFLR
jgi:hypothetical protein